MIVLGITDGHNASAAVVRDGKLIAAVQEERLTRVKNQWGMPEKAIEQVLSLAGVTRDQVDIFAVTGVYEDKEQDWDRDSVLARYEAARPRRARQMLKQVGPLMEARRGQVAAKRRERLAAAGLPAEKTVVVEHHACHAATAYWGGPRDGEKTLVLTADGAGDYLSATVNVATPAGIERLAEIPLEHSVGRLYSNITYLMGMVPLEHEYKLMGMAPYGERSEKATDKIKNEFWKFYRRGQGGLTWSYDPSAPAMHEAIPHLSKVIHLARFDYLAAGLQRFLEEFLIDWVRDCIRETGIRRIALSGGVFMNVKANKRILELPEVESMYIFPSCGDETNSIGAAFHAYAEDRRKRGMPIDLKHVESFYLGAPVDDAEVEQALSRRAGAGLKVSRPADPEDEVGRLLAAGEVVARASGPMEFGSRALGNRSILADPSRHDVTRIINDMIKNRDFWMPFAPAMLQERTEEYVVKPKGFFAPYMIMAMDSVPAKRAAMQAALHPADHTARPQEVVEGWNPGFHRVISSFASRRGDAVVLNTSFNLHGYPIVQTAEDALDVLERSGLQHVQVGSFLVSKS
jgi:carbamoyltransferase